MFAKGSKNRLTPHDLPRFPGATLFERLARVVCRAECIPRKELYEAWETARRTRRLLPRGRAVDLCGGHGLLAFAMALLDRSSGDALTVDTARPLSAARLSAAVLAEWPELAGRVHYQVASLEEVVINAGDVVVSCHACGALTDRVLALAIAARAAVAVMPCCHDAETSDGRPLLGWMDVAAAVDVMRAVRLEQQGYRVWTQLIPAEITPKHRLLIGRPRNEVS